MWLKNWNFALNTCVFTYMWLKNCNFALNTYVFTYVLALWKPSKKTKNITPPIFWYFVDNIWGYNSNANSPRCHVGNKVKFKVKVQEKGQEFFSYSYILNDSRFGFFERLAKKWHQFQLSRTYGYGDMVATILTGAPFFAEIAKNGRGIAQKPYVRLS